MVDLPEPERPTNATVLPGLTSKLIPLSADFSWPGYANVTLSKANLPSTLSILNTPLSGSGAVSNNSNTVVQAAIPR